MYKIVFSDAAHFEYNTIGEIINAMDNLSDYDSLSFEVNWWDGSSQYRKGQMASELDGFLSEFNRDGIVSVVVFVIPKD